MDTCNLVIGSKRKATNHTRSIQVCDFGNRQLHKMDSSRAIGPDHNNKRNMVYRAQHILLICYSIPHTIITDNGAQFNNEEITLFTQDKGTEIRFVLIAHPQMNGQVEAANKIIMKLLKKKFSDAKGHGQKSYQKFSR